METKMYWVTATIGILLADLFYRHFQLWCKEEGLRRFQKMISEIGDMWK
jgi:hypothetical protein